MAAIRAIGPVLQFAALALLKDVLGVKQGESVLITTDADADPDVSKSLQIAAHLLGAKPVLMTLDPPLPLQGLLADEFIPEPVRAAIQHTDLWFDNTNPYMAGSKAFDAVMHNGRTRYFLGGGLPADALIRMYGKIDLHALFSITAEFQAVFDLKAGTQFRITSPMGTDIVFNTKSMRKSDAFQLGKATKPGGYFPPGAAAFAPDISTVKGTIVIEAVQHDYYSIISEPLTLEMDGNIQSVTGGGTELRAINRALRRAANGGYGGVVHFTCGLHPAARFTGTSFHEDTRVMGCNAVGFGMLPGTPGGGENHPDGVIRNQSIWIDGEHVVDNGVIRAPVSVAKAIGNLNSLYG